MPEPISTEEASKLHEYWNAANYLTVGQIYLKDNPLLEAPLSKEDRENLDEPESVSTVGLAVNIHMLATIRIVNPYLALIHIHDWLESTLDLVRPGVRSWISGVPYKDVIGKREVAEKEFDVFLQRTGLPPEQVAQLPPEKKPKSFVDYIESDYGVLIKRIGFDDIVPPKEYTIATNKREEAEQDKIRVRISANAEKQRLTIVGQGEANRIKSVNDAIKDGGDTALEIRRLEAAENIGESGNMFVVDGHNLNLLLNPAERHRKEDKPWKSQAGSEKQGKSGQQQQGGSGHSSGDQPTDPQKKSA